MAFEKTQKDSAHKILYGLQHELQAPNMLRWIILIYPPNPLSIFLTTALYPRSLISIVCLTWLPYSPTSSGVLPMGDMNKRSEGERKEMVSIYSPMSAFLYLNLQSFRQPLPMLSSHKSVVLNQGRFRESDLRGEYTKTREWKQYL